MENNYGLDSKVLDYLMQKRKPQNDNIGALAGGIAQGASQLGTLGGQSADVSGFQKTMQAFDAARGRQQQQQDQANLMAAQLQDKRAQQVAARDQSITDRDEQRLYAEDVFQKEQQAKKDLANLNQQNKLGLIAAQNKGWEDKQDYLAKNKPKSTKPAIASKEIDRDFRKDYLNFITGGKENSALAINQLRGYVNFLKDQENDLIQEGSGKFVSYLPDWMRSNQAIKMREDITGVAMQGLKDIFVGAISDGERKALAATFYNDKLPPNENLKILERKLSMMEDLYKNKLEAAKYYEKNDTLGGFKGISRRDNVEMLAEKDPVAQKDKTPSNTAFASDNIKNEKFSPFRKQAGQWQDGDIVRLSSGLKIKKGGSWVPYSEEPQMNRKFSNLED